MTGDRGLALIPREPLGNIRCPTSVFRVMNIQPMSFVRANALGTLVFVGSVTLVLVPHAYV